MQVPLMPGASRKLGWGELIGLGLLVVALAMVVWPRGSVGELVPRGTPLPELMAEGWLNVETIPSRENLAGKVVLVDFWATWCGPCRASMPKLAQIHEKYEPLGVEFIGLTPEPASDRSLVEGFVKSVEGFVWPVGYGAGMVFDLLSINGVPTMVVFGKDGRAVWSGASVWELDLALDEALSR